MLLPLLFEVFRRPEVLQSRAVWGLLAIFGVLLLALSIHEFSHALVAWRLGDETARRLGRVSLNPLAHLDRWGTLFLLFVGIGWGKPVPVDPLQLRGGHRGMALVAAAGPLSNFLVAVLLAIPMREGLIAWHSPLAYPVPFAQPALEWMAADLLGAAVFLNLALGLFNLIPLPPLDGSRLWVALLPASWAYRIAQVEVAGIGLVLGFVIALRLGGAPDVLGSLLGAVQLASRLVVGR